MSTSHAVEFYEKCLRLAIEARDEACQAGDYSRFSIAELDVQNYQTMLNNAKAQLNSCVEGSKGG